MKKTEPTFIYTDKETILSDRIRRLAGMLYTLVEHLGLEFRETHSKYKLVEKQ